MQAGKTIPTNECGLASLEFSMRRGDAGSLWDCVNCNCVCLFPALFKGHAPTRESGQEVFLNIMGRLGSGRVGLGRVGSGGFKL